MLACMPSSPYFIILVLDFRLRMEIVFFSLCTAGQAIAKRLGMQLKSVHKSLRSSIAEYNEILKLHQCLMDKEIIFDDVTRDDWSGWQRLSNINRLQLDPIRRQAVDIIKLTKCAKVESELCISEMNNVLEYFNTQHSYYIEAISHYSDDDCSLSRGIVSLITKRVIELEAQITIAREHFPPEICEKHTYPDTFHSKYIALLFEYNVYGQIPNECSVIAECDEQPISNLSSESDDDTDDSELYSDDCEEVD